MLINGRKSITVMVGLALATVLLGGCGQREMMVVNGTKVSKSQFYAKLEQVTVPARGGNIQAGNFVARQMIEDMIWAQFAKEQGVVPTEEQINSKLEALRRQSAGNLQNVLRERGMTLTDLRAQIAVEQAKINVISKGVTVADSDVKQTYDVALKMPSSRYKRPERVRVSAIVVKSKDKILLAKKRLNSAEDFSKVATELSEDPSGKRSAGQLGWLDKTMQRLPKPIITTAFGLAVTQFSDPMMVQGSWVIVKCEQKQASKVTPYNEAKDEIKEQLALGKGLKAGNFRDDLQSFIRKANIIVKASNYKRIPDEIKKEIGGSKAITGDESKSKPKP